MKLIERRFLRGPNLWSRAPCIMAVVDADQHAAWALLARLQDLQAAAGAGAPFGLVVPVPGQPGQARIVAEYRVEEVARLALQGALAGDVSLGSLRAAASAAVKDDTRVRMPVIAVTGTNGKTTTTLMIAHTLRLAGFCTGTTTTEGVFINRERIEEGDCAGFHSARRVFASNKVDIAVLETARGGILKRGLAFQRCSVGVVLNVGADHLGLDGIETVEQLAKVKAVVAHSASGAAVLNADDPHCVAMAAGLAEGTECIYFSMDPGNPVLRAHLERGGRAAWLEDGALLLASEAGRQPLLMAAAMPAALDGHARYNVANGLAAAAALMASGVAAGQITAGLASFVTDSASNPLRSNEYKSGGVTIVVDYAHNPAAYRALGAMAAARCAGRRRVVATAPGDRRSEDLLDIGRACADSFDELFVYEADPRGRAGGATAQAILDGARAAGKPEDQLHAIVPVAQAFAAAHAASRPGDMLLFACGSAATAQSIVARYVGGEHAGIAK